MKFFNKGCGNKLCSGICSAFTVRQLAKECKHAKTFQPAKRAKVPKLVKTFTARQARQGAKRAKTILKIMLRA